MDVSNLLMRISKVYMEFRPDSDSELGYMAFQPVNAADEGFIEIQV